MPLRVGVVGLGIGRTHLSYYSKMPEVELAGVADLRTDAAAQMAEQHKIEAFSTADELLEKGDLELISICTPPKSHRSITELAASKGVHVFCEKPMAPSVTDCDAMIDVCEQNNVKLMIGLKKRFAPAYCFIRDELDFGQILWANYKFALGRVDKDWFWEEDDGGGPILENTVHAIDNVRSLMGNVIRVYAEGGTLFMEQRAPQIDTAVFTLRFESGGIATIAAGYGSEWGFTQEVLAISSKKMAAEVHGGFDNPTDLRYIYRSNPNDVKTMYFDDASGFSGEFEHIVECIKEDKALIPNGVEGREAVRVCLAVKESARTGKPVSIE